MKLIKNLIIGKKEKDAILTLCERSTNYMIMQKLVYGKHADNENYNI